MNLIEKIRQLGHGLRLTRDVEFRESGAMCSEAIVKKKDWFPGFAFMEPTYIITFQANREELEMNVPEWLYDQMKEGHRVALSYQRVYKYEQDYVPPDFNEKELISTNCVDYEFLDAELLKDE